eukprot:scaffold166822_cov33-Tisochrysis_lutea.AAC.3
MATISRMAAISLARHTRWVSRSCLAYASAPTVPPIVFKSHADAMGGEPSNPMPVPIATCRDPSPCLAHSTSRAQISSRVPEGRWSTCGVIGSASSTARDALELSKIGEASLHTRKAPPTTAKKRVRSKARREVRSRAPRTPTIACCSVCARSACTCAKRSASSTASKASLVVA